MTKLKVWVLLFIGALLISCGGNKSKVVDKNIPEELRILNEKLESNPNDVALLNQRANYFIKQKQVDLAMTDISKAIKLDSTKSDLYLTLSDVYFLGGKYLGCKEAIAKAILRNPTDKNAYVKFAELSLYYKNYDEVFKSVEKALEIDKVNPKAFFVRGYAHKENGDTSRAIQNFMEATAQDPNYFDAYIELGLLYACKHDKLAVTCYQNALKARPNSVEALYNLGMYYQENEDFDNAIIQYSSILQFDSKNKLAPYNMGYIYLKHLSDFPKAVKFFSNAIVADSTYLDAYYNRGLSYEGLKDYQSARNDYAKVLKMNVNYKLAIEAMNRLDSYNIKSK